MLLEVIDLTHPKNIELLRLWDQKEAAYVQQLRFIRINSVSPHTVIVSRTGKHPTLMAASTDDMEIMN
jgi:translation machinery-associated protein 16